MDFRKKKAKEASDACKVASENSSSKSACKRASELSLEIYHMINDRDSKARYLDVAKYWAKRPKKRQTSK